MKVLLTGGTGFLGGVVARELLDAGHGVRALVRATSNRDALARLGVELAEGDVTDRASVERATGGIDAVVHTAGNVGARPRDKDDVFRVNVDGTRNVLGAALAKGVKRVVHTSSTAAVGATKDPQILDESAAWTLGDLGYDYVVSKRRAEEAALEFVEAGLEVVVVNPGIIFGPGDVNLGSTKYVAEYLRGRNRFYTSGGASACDVRDAAKAIVAALERGRSGERYILAGQNATYRELLEKLHAITGLAKPVALPALVGWAMAMLSEGVGSVVPHGLEEVNRPVLRMGTLFQAFDCAKARRELGYEARSLDETLRDTVRDHLARGVIEPTTSELRALAAMESPSTTAAV